MSTSVDAVRDAMQALCGELFAAHQRLDPEAIKRLYARLPDGIYFWERALAYDFSQVAEHGGCPGHERRRARADARASSGPVAREIPAGSR